MGKVRIPLYMKTFQCIGSACEDNCCMSDWLVCVDKKIYEKYRSIKDEKMRSAILRTISINKHSKSDANYAVIKFGKHHKCPHLNDNNMCSLQISFGEAYLGDVCLTYPRFLNVVDGVYEKGASLSCPEVARLILTDQDGIKFEELDLDDHERLVVSHIFNSSTGHILKKYFWDLRLFSIQVLKTREYSLWERMIILGLFYEKLQARCSESPNFSPLDLIDTYTRMVTESLFKELLDGIPSAITLQRRLLKQLADIRFKQRVSDQRYLELFSQFLKGVGYFEEGDMTRIENNWQEATRCYYLPFMKEHEYMLENYLVNLVFKNLFPFTGEKTVFESFAMLVMHYSLLKMHLVGLAGFYKENFDHEVVIKMVQSFCKIVEHNPLYIKSIHDLLEEDNMINMAYMCILIKD